VGGFLGMVVCVGIMHSFMCAYSRVYVVCAYSKVYGVCAYSKVYQAKNLEAKLCVCVCEREHVRGKAVNVRV